MTKLIRKASMFIILSMSLVPIQIFAHGTEDEHKKEIVLSTYFLTGFAILFVLFLALYLMTRNKARRLQNAKKQEDRVKRQQLTKMVNVFKWVWILSLVGLFISGTMSLSGDKHKEITMADIHGLGYSSDGQRIMIPSHYGIKVYSDDHWFDGEGAAHDYMGFSMVDDGFYSSGHPAKGSKKKNPFGLIKSTNEGESFEILDAYGEIDFHLMSAGYHTHMIYTVNPMIMGKSSSKLKPTGMFYTKDEGKTWVESAMTGFSGESTALAAHSTNEAMVAIGSTNGLYLSKDYGNQFEKILSDTQVTSLFFNNKGLLFVGGYNEGVSLLQMDMESKQTTDIEIPTLTEDAVMYIAQNPVNELELVFATFKKDVYLSEDQGMTWTKIADQGKGISE